jgi:hypothetical protein
MFGNVLLGCSSQTCGTYATPRLWRSNLVGLACEDKLVSGPILARHLGSCILTTCVARSQMFDWLVARINAAIGEDKSAAASVGVLDIYGFESFKTNDFEQVQIFLALGGSCCFASSKCQ